ncbi:MAG: DUF362 domain-containing protein, partial [Spirochaetes bacterium]|nr:DUF362 domain-containing protein [Spirochaetota bacterium]
MNRRDFFKKTFKYLAGFITGSIIKDFDKGVNIILGQETEEKTYDLVAIKNGEVEQMFDEAIKYLGGLNKYIRKNSTVLIKPNIGFALAPERAATTNPALVAHLVKRSFESGAKKVYIFDNSAENSELCYKISQIEEAAKKAGATVIPSNNQKYYQLIKIPKAQVLKEAYVHEIFLEADIFINVPILKTHSSTKATIGLKNNMGIVWDRGYWHRTNLHQCIADFAVFRKPDLTIVDAYRALIRHGPRGVSMEDVRVMKTLIISPDPVAADAAGAKLLN